MFIEDGSFCLAEQATKGEKTVILCSCLISQAPSSFFLTMLSSYSTCTVRYRYTCTVHVTSLHELRLHIIGAASKIDSTGTKVGLRASYIIHCSHWLLCFLYMYMYNCNDYTKFIKLWQLGYMYMYTVFQNQERYGPHFEGDRLPICNNSIYKSVETTHIFLLVTTIA